MKHTLYFFIFLLIPMHSVSCMDFSQVTKWFKRSKRRAEKEEYPEKSLNTIALYGLWGNITINSWNEPKILIEKEIIIPEHATPLKSSISTNKNQLTIETLAPKEHASSSGIFNYTITAPKHMTIRIVNNEGNITVKNRDGDVHITNDKGTAFLENITKEVTYEGGKGAITITKSKGPITLHAHTSDITLEHIAGPINAHVAKGSINGDHIYGKTDLTISRGSVKCTNVHHDLKAFAEQGKIIVKQFSGTTLLTAPQSSVILTKPTITSDDHVFIEAKQNISLRLDPGANACIYARAPRGMILSSIPITLEPLTMKLNKETWRTMRHSVKGIIGDGGAPLTLESAQGNIEIQVPSWLRN